MAEIVRRTIGYVGGFAATAWGTAAATNVVIGDGETLEQKVHDAITSVPDLLQGYHRMRYIAEHSEQINKGLEYVRDHAPTPESLEAATRQAYQTLTSLNHAMSHFAKAKDSIMSWSFSQQDTYDQLVKGWNELPNLDAFKHLASSAKQAGEIIKYVRQVDLNPIYVATVNAADNFSRDEVWATLGVATASLGLGIAAGRYISQFWSRRGRPGIFARYVERLGVRMYPEWHKKNVKKSLGPEKYRIAEEHFRERFLAEQAQQPHDGPQREADRL